MAKGYRAKRNKAHKGDSMTDEQKTDTPTATVHESKKVKAVAGPAEDVKVETQKVDAKFGNVEGSINYPRVTALSPAGALLIAASQPLTKTVTKTVDGKETEVDEPLSDTDKFLKYFNAGYDAAMRITARNELAVLIEGPEKQIDMVAKRIAKIKFGDDSEESVKKVRALPEFASLVAVMS